MKAAGQQQASLPLGPVMLDVVGTTLTAEDIRRIQHPLTGGVILFARNYENRQQLVALTAAIHAARPGVLIAVDHEGGRVQRFKSDGFTHLPAMRVLGELWDKDVLQATKLATAVGFVLAAELRACGVDLSFTPVLDLDFGVSGVIGSRAFHRDPRVVTLLAKSLNHGLALAGMANCGKHFPGHGFVEADSHIAVPVDERDLKDIIGDDAAPYDWLGMSILRRDLGFQGVIFSDDLSMEGASVAGSVIEGAKAALTAGCDMVLICNAPDKADQLLQGLKTKVSSVSAARIAALVPSGTAPDWDALQQDERFLAARDLLKTLA